MMILFVDTAEIDWLHRMPGERQLAPRETSSTHQTEKKKKNFFWKQYYKTATSYIKNVTGTSVNTSKGKKEMLHVC